MQTSTKIAQFMKQEKYDDIEVEDTEFSILLVEEYRYKEECFYDEGREKYEKFAKGLYLEDADYSLERSGAQRAGPAKSDSASIVRAVSVRNFSGAMFDRRRLACIMQHRTKQNMEDEDLGMSAPMEVDSSSSDHLFKEVESIRKLAADKDEYEKNAVKEASNMLV